MNHPTPRYSFLKRIHAFRRHTIAIHKRIWLLMTAPIFIWVTVIFHSLIFACAFLLRYVELEVNPKLESPVNAIYWAFATVTTVGYGDVVPMTDIGKGLAILLMITGSMFAAIYTALFASTLLATELNQVERDVRGVKTQFSELSTKFQVDEKQLLDLMVKLQEILNNQQK